jgi:hypothetical protein
LSALLGEQAVTINKRIKTGNDFTGPHLMRKYRYKTLLKNTLISAAQFNGLIKKGKAICLSFLVWNKN